MDGSKELRKIEKEIIEARALIIKSNNVTNSLAADVRSIAKRQSTYERNLTASNVVVYIIFAVLAMVGAHLVYDARQGSLESELTHARKEAQEAQEELDAIKKETGADPEAEDKNLMTLYELISKGERQQTLDLYETIRHDNLSFLESKLLRDITHQFRSELSMQHYLAALEMLDSKKYPDAIEAFRRSLSFKNDAGHAKAARIHMANALRLQGKPREAIAVLQKVSEEHLDRELADDAMWHLAQSHEDAHQKDEALSVLRALMRRYPDSQYYRAARIRAAELKLRMWRDDH